MRVESSTSALPPPQLSTEQVKTSTYSIESVLVPPQAPTFPRLAQFFNWLWSWVRPLFLFCLPKKEPIKPSPPAPDVVRTIKAAQAKKNAPSPIVGAVKQIIVPAALCGAISAHSSFAGSMLQARASMISPSVSGAVTNILFWASEHPGQLVLTAALTGKMLTKMRDFIYPLGRQPDGTLQSQVNYKRAAFVAGVLYTGYKMYDAATDGNIDSSLMIRLGEYAATALSPVASAADGIAKYMWENQFLQIPSSITIPYVEISMPICVGIPYTRFRLPWMPLAGVIKVPTLAAKKATDWAARKAPYRVVKGAAKVVEVLDNTADELSASVGKVKMGLGIGSTAVAVTKSVGSTLIATGSAALGALGIVQQ